MSIVRVIGIVLFVLGILGLVYGGFTYTAETHEADLGPIDIQVQDKEHVDVPIWLSVVAVVVGGGLVFLGRGKRPRAQ
jgi:hypothetical protein